MGTRGHERPIEPKGDEWVSNERTKGNDVIPDNCNNSCYIIDSRSIETAIAELEQDLKILKGLEYAYNDNLDNRKDAWKNGAALVRDDYLPDYAKSMAADQLDLDAWPLPFIDWERATEILRERYISINYNGVTYWVKRPI